MVQLSSINMLISEQAYESHMKVMLIVLKVTIKTIVRMGLCFGEKYN